MSIPRNPFPPVVPPIKANSDGSSGVKTALIDESVTSLTLPATCGIGNYPCSAYVPETVPYGASALKSQFLHKSTLLRICSRLFFFGTKKEQTQGKSGTRDSFVCTAIGADQN
jgi:hypothetical protein